MTLDVLTAVIGGVDGADKEGRIGNVISLSDWNMCSKPASVRTGSFVGIEMMLLPEGLGVSDAAHPDVLLASVLIGLLLAVFVIVDVARA